MFTFIVYFVYSNNMVLYKQTILFDSFINFLFIFDVYFVSIEISNLDLVTGCLY